MQGTVDKLWRNQRPDGSEYWVLSIDGQRYSAFEPDLMRGIEAGHRVEFAFTQSRGHRNLTALKRLSPGPGDTSTLPSPSPEALRIVRTSCLRTAAELLSGSTMLPEQKLLAAAKMAERLEEHVLGKPSPVARSQNSAATGSQPKREEKNGR